VKRSPSIQTRYGNGLKTVAYVFCFVFNIMYHIRCLNISVVTGVSVNWRSNTLKCELFFITFLKKKLKVKLFLHAPRKHVRSLEVCLDSSLKSVLGKGK
jgi:hypothetical protein